LESGTDTEDPRSADGKRARRLKLELADVPKWREAAPYMARTNALLERIAGRLGDPADPDPLQTLIADDAIETRRRTRS
ncbi:MAG: hypothetical protein ACREEY_17450, partial [Brevundimonas sp.]